MVYGEFTDNSTGLRRWSSQALRGKDNKFFTAVTGYRVCGGSIITSPIGSAFSREDEHHRTRHISSPRPRKLFLLDLQTIIHHLQEKGNAILLMLDSNGQLQDDHDLQQFVATCDLSWLASIRSSPFHVHQVWPLTYRRYAQMLHYYVLSESCRNALISLRSPIRPPRFVYRSRHAVSLRSGTTCTTSNSCSKYTHTEVRKSGIDCDLPSINAPILRGTPHGKAHQRS